MPPYRVCSKCSKLPVMRGDSNSSAARSSETRRGARYIAALVLGCALSMANSAVAVTVVTGLDAYAAGATSRDSEGTAPVQTVQVYDTDYPFIDYSGKPTRNEIARLQKRLDRGEAHLRYEPAHGYLDSLLSALNIDLSSQVLVFSKTSLQTDAIGPQTPRAIYFNDDTYVGWIRNSGLLEIVTMDADRGPVFYTLANADASGAHVQRETLRCLTCHDSFSEMGGGVPYFLFESMYNVAGRQIHPDVVARETLDSTPISERWGGWYVTGEDNGAFHLGNIQAPLTRTPMDLTRAYRGSLPSLAGLFDTSAYPTDKSDIVALLVLEHQVSVHNFIIHANYKSRALLAKERPDALIEGTGGAGSVHWRDLTRQVQVRLSAMLEPLVRGMLMVDAAPLPRPMASSSGYTTQFGSQGPRDSKNRSLRDLDLRTRIFRYPLSFLVYSESFAALPLSVKEHLYGRFGDILSGQDHSGAYRSLAPADRHAALEILQCTQPEFAQSLAQR